MHLLPSMAVLFISGGFMHHGLIQVQLPCPLFLITWLCTISNPRHGGWMDPIPDIGPFLGQSTPQGRNNKVCSHKLRYVGIGLCKPFQYQLSLSYEGIIQFQTLASPSYACTLGQKQPPVLNQVSWTPDIIMSVLPHSQFHMITLPNYVNWCGHLLNTQIHEIRINLAICRHPILSTSAHIFNTQTFWIEERICSHLNSQFNEPRNAPS